MNKKGFIMFPMFAFVFITFFAIIFLGIALFMFNQIDSVLDQDIDVGAVNLADVNNQTFGQLNDGFVNNADTIGIITLLTMCVLMILNGALIGKRYPRLFFIIDILILVFIFIVSVYISQTYETFINSTDVLALYLNDLGNSSAFILNLPTIIATLGALIMVVSYIGLKPRREASLNEF